MSKLSFRARALDASKPMPIYMAEELPDLPDYSAINRAVPQMPSGMQKEEECEHHLQRAICTGLIIPTPEVTSLTDVKIYDKIYPADYKLPRQLIHMQPFAMEQDVPEYDMDSEDEKWVDTQSCKMGLTAFQFEEMMDRLEKSSGQTVVTLNEAKALLKEDDELIIAVFDYWLNKRLKTQHPLLLSVKTEHRLGTTANNPYLAFRRRTEKMQTRKNRKNDETSYEKMLKLRRDLSRAVTLLEMVKKREKIKREILHLTVQVYEKRYQAQDFNGLIIAEMSTFKPLRPAFAPIFTNQFGTHQNWTNKLSGKEESVFRKEKRQYKKRKHKIDFRNRGFEGCSVTSSQRTGFNPNNRAIVENRIETLISSDEESQPLPQLQFTITSDRDDDEAAEEGQFYFRRNKYNTYLPPVQNGFGNWPWCDKSDGGKAEKKYRFALTSLHKPLSKSMGLTRRRMGRGGRIILDRYSAHIDDIWSSLDFTIREKKQEIFSELKSSTVHNSSVKKNCLHFHPKSYPETELGQAEEDFSDVEIKEISRARLKSLPYPFPEETASICINLESDSFTNESFTSEFNVTDYFPVDSISDVDYSISSVNDLNVITNNDHKTDNLGCSHFLVFPEIDKFFITQTKLQNNQILDYINSKNSGSPSSLCPTSTINNFCSITNSYGSLNDELINETREINDSNTFSMITTPLNSRFVKNNSSKGIKLFNVLETTLDSSTSDTSSIKEQTSIQNDIISHFYSSKILPNQSHHKSNQTIILSSFKRNQANVISSHKLENLNSEFQQIPNENK